MQFGTAYTVAFYLTVVVMFLGVFGLGAIIYGHDQRRTRRKRSDRVQRQRE